MPPAWPPRAAGLLLNIGCCPRAPLPQGHQERVSAVTLLSELEMEISNKELVTPRLIFISHQLDCFFSGLFLTYIDCMLFSAQSRLLCPL